MNVASSDRRALFSASALAWAEACAYRGALDRDEIGWGLAEVGGGDATRLADVSARMDRCFAG